MFFEKKEWAGEPDVGDEPDHSKRWDDVQIKPDPGSFS